MIWRLRISDSGAPTNAETPLFWLLAVYEFVELSEMFGYATDLRSKTQGRGNYTMQFERYEEVPHNIADKILGRHS